MVFSETTHLLSIIVTLAYLSSDTTYRNVSLSMQLFTGTNIVVAVALAYIAIAAQQVIPCTIVNG
jgi:hypothetical protein